MLVKSSNFSKDKPLLILRLSDICSKRHLCEVLATYPDLIYPLGRAHPAYCLSPSPSYSLRANVTKFYFTLKPMTKKRSCITLPPAHSWRQRRPHQHLQRRLGPDHGGRVLEVGRVQGQECRQVWSFAHVVSSRLQVSPRSTPHK